MWTYQQSTGQLTDDAGDLVGTGYAGGNAGANPEGVNNPALQNVHNVGPLPQGLYTIEKPIDGHTGPYSLPLLPDPANQMFHRSDFLIHGDRVGHAGEQIASDGCIILAPNIRHAVWNSGDRQLQVVA